MIRARFPLFQTPIDCAQGYWEELAKGLQEGDGVLDATCGRGKDSLFLARLCAQSGALLFCQDVQKSAIETTRQLLEEQLPAFAQTVQFVLQSHEILPAVPNCKLIVYNLGYLPKGDKGLTTQVESTLQSVTGALSLLALGGLISITCYPGHIEGAKEETALLSFLANLDPKQWCCTHMRWHNRSNSPSLFLLQRFI